MPSSPEEVQDKTLDWLFSLPSSSSTPKGSEESKEGAESTYTNHGTSSLTSSYEGGLVTSGVNTPEKVCPLSYSAVVGGCLRLDGATHCASGACVSSYFLYPAVVRHSITVSPSLARPFHHCVSRKILSEVWSIVTQLQNEAAPLLVAAESQAAAAAAEEAAATSPAVSTGTTAETAATTSPLLAMAAAVAAVEHWATGGAPGWSHQQAAGEAVEKGKEKKQAKPEPGRGEAVAVRERGPLVSTLLVAPRLHPFNAAKFDNFARNLAIALKQTPIMDRIEVEVCVCVCMCAMCCRALVYWCIPRIIFFKWGARCARGDRSCLCCRALILRWCPPLLVQRLLLLPFSLALLVAFEDTLPSSVTVDQPAQNIFADKNAPPRSSQTTARRPPLAGLPPGVGVRWRHR